MLKLYTFIKILFPVRLFLLYAALADLKGRFHRYSFEGWHLNIHMPKYYLYVLVTVVRLCIQISYSSFHMNMNMANIFVLWLFGSIFVKHYSYP